MVSSEALLIYLDWIINFVVNTDDSDKKLGSVIIQNNKAIELFSRRLSKPQRNYTTTERELLTIVEGLRQFLGIIFGYEINVSLYHKNLLYAATLSVSQRVILWWLILKEFGPNI